jgi:integrase/recombinase XerC
LRNLLANLQSRIWRDLLRDWERFLRAANHPEATRYNYLLAGCQLAVYLATAMPGSGPACDPCRVSTRQVIAFQAWVIETRSPASSLNKHKGLQQFFRWLGQEDEMQRSPMSGVPLPDAGQKLIPLISDAETGQILDACKESSFQQLRD